jgi:hypothetical protein
MDCVLRVHNRLCFNELWRQKTVAKGSFLLLEAFVKSYIDSTFVARFDGATRGENTGHS